MNIQIKHQIKHMKNGLSKLRVYKVFILIQHNNLDPDLSGLATLGG